MGRLRPWHNLPPVLQCSKYRRLLENSAGNSSSSFSTDNLSDTSDDADWSGIGGDGGDASDRKEKNAKRKGNKSGGRRNRKKDGNRQLIQDSFQELMSYSCGQCGHVQTLQAEELKSILGHAFRLAYAAHLQKAAGLHDYPGGSTSPPPPSPPPTHHLTTAGGSRHHRLGGGSPSLHSLQSTSGSSPSTAPHLLHSTTSTSSHHLHHLHTTSSSTTTAPSSLKHHVGYSSTTTSNNNNNNSQHAATNSSSSSGSSKGLPGGRLHTHTDQRPCDQSCLANSESCSSSSGVSSIQGGIRHTGKMRTPARLPGLQTDHSTSRSHLDTAHSPDSDTSNSPTDHNTSHRLLDKPPLLKQFSVPPLEDAPPIPTSSTSSPTHHLVDPLFPSSSANNINNNNHSPSGSSSSTNNLNCGGGQSNSCGGVGLGYINDGSKDSAKGGNTGTDCCASSSVLVHNIAPGEPDSNTATHHLLESSSTHSNSPIHTQSPLHSTHTQSPLHSTHSHSPIHVTHSQSPLHSIHSSSPLHSSHSQSPLHSTHSHSPLHTTSHHHPHSQSPLHSTHSQSPLHSAQSSVLSSQGSSHCPSPPPLPERSDSLAAPDEPHLRAAAWFQAGIPREIALEVLGREPLGAFLVRESSSKPGCYALSLRVPADFAAGGIAHYLIVRTNRGYRIKGFTKEFPTLRTLITHHSVMPELLPVPLLLTRHNPAYSSGQDTHDCNEDDPDYNTLSDFRKMMADLNVWGQAAEGQTRGGTVCRCLPLVSGVCEEVADFNHWGHEAESLPQRWGTGGRCVPLVSRVGETVTCIKEQSVGVKV